MTSVLLIDGKVSHYNDDKKIECSQLKGKRWIERMISRETKCKMLNEKVCNEKSI